MLAKILNQVINKMSYNYTQFCNKIVLIKEILFYFPKPMLQELL
jgi:hypothetical protein